MSHFVLCLRPEADFARVGVTVPATLEVAYLRPDDAEAEALMKRAEALVIPAVGPKLPASLFEGAPLKLVQVTGAGVDRLDREALLRLGIPVANVPGGSNGALAEYAVTSASALLRRFPASTGAIRAGNYVALRARLVGENLAGIDGQLVGIVGLGIIGIAVARAFQAAGARIAWFDPKPADPEAAEALGGERLDLPELLARADVVSLHVPLLPATTNLIGAAELAAVKPGAILVHASRGGVVDEAALAASLESGHLGGAAVDVYSTEPPTPDNPLLNLSDAAAERVILTPHIAGVTRQASAFLFRSAWENVEGVLVGGRPPRARVY